MKFSRQRGQALLEVVVALAIGVVVVTGFVSLAVVSVRNSQFSTNKATATNLAEEGIEAMITIRDLNTDGAISGAAAGNWQGLVGSSLGSCSSDPIQDCASDFQLSTCTPPASFSQHCITKTSTPETGLNSIFSRKIQITDSGTNNVKNVTVVVWWTDSSGQHTSVLSRKLHKDKLE